MKSIEFILEDDSLPQEVLDKAKDINHDCQPYLQAVFKPMDYPLWRGIPDDNNVITKRVRLKDRKPTDTPQNIHDAMNKYFKDNFGGEFRDALFATNASNEAGGYGKKYYVFPIGKFTFLWSPVYTDLYVELRREMKKHENFGESELNAFLDSGKYQTTDLQSAISSSREIMIRCEAYHGIRYTTNVYDNRAIIDKIIYEK